MVENYINYAQHENSQGHENWMLISVALGIQ